MKVDVDAYWYRREDRLVPLTAEPTRWAFDGREYSVDLNDDTKALFWEALQPWLEISQPVDPSAAAPAEQPAPPIMERVPAPAAEAPPTSSNSSPPVPKPTPPKPAAPKPTPPPSPKLAAPTVSGTLDTRQLNEIRVAYHSGQEDSWYAGPSNKRVRAAIAAWGRAQGLENVIYTASNSQQLPVMTPNTGVATGRIGRELVRRFLEAHPEVMNRPRV